MLISFFSFCMMKDGLKRIVSCIEYEINENNEKTPCNELMVISSNSFNSFFSLFVNIKDPISAVIQNHAFCGQFCVCFCLPFSGAISKSQPTGCGHTLALCPLPGWRVAAAPSTPAKAKRPKP